MTRLSRPPYPRRTASRHAGRRALLVSLALVLAACSSYPLGMSKEEWLRLTPEQQMAARMKQADLNRANAERRAQQAAARRQRYAAMEAAERRRITELYQSAHYGNVLECVVEGGVAEVRRGWRNYTPVPFTLARGEVKSVTLSAGNRNGKFWAQYSANGLGLKICYGDPRHGGGRYCAAINGRSQDFSMGIMRHVTVARTFRDANVMCAYRPEHDMPQVYLRRHNPRVYRVVHHYHYQSRPQHTPAVFRRRYNRPAPEVRVKSVIHEHRDQNYDAAPTPHRARRRTYEVTPPVVRAAPRMTPVPNQSPQYTPPQYTPPRYVPPQYVPPQEVDASPGVKPGPNVPAHARSHVVASPNSAVKKTDAAAGPVTSQNPGKKSDKKANGKKLAKKGKGKAEEEQNSEGVEDDEYLTSAPAPGKGHGRGKSEKKYLIEEFFK